MSELARAAGIAKSTLASWEWGKVSPTLRLLEKVARVLDVPVSALIDDAAANLPDVRSRAG